MEKKLPNSQLDGFARTATTVLETETGRTSIGKMRKMKTTGSLKECLKSVIKEYIYDPYSIVKRRRNDDENWIDVNYYDLLGDDVIEGYTYYVMTENDKCEIKFE